MPSDIGAQITNSKPKLEFADLAGVPSPLTLDNLDELNKFGNEGLNIYLTSNEDISQTPSWMKGVKPNADGKTEGAKSCAIIVVDKGDGLVDAYYMYFYAFNWGGIVLEKNLGNHVGDWFVCNFYIPTKLRLTTTTGNTQWSASKMGCQRQFGILNMLQAKLSNTPS